MLVRPIEERDLGRLYELAQEAGYGLTTLPPDEAVLQRRIRQSQRSFGYPADRPGPETYLFVLEDVDSGVVQGISGIVAKVGGYEPFWTYRLDTVVQESRQLGIRREIPVLNLLAEHDGPSEIGSLFCSPGYRQRGAGRLLSKVRFLFMAEHSQLFEDRVLAEMRGVIDSQGQSPFWDAIGRHFFGMSYHQADYLVMADKRFIGELMPKHPIYVPLLPDDAQAVIDQVHPLTRPALALLEDEGFRRTGEVDIFEGGPVLSCSCERVGMIRRSRRARIAELTDESDGAGDHVVLNPELRGRATLATVRELREGDVALSRAVAELLGLSVGDACRYGLLRPPALRGPS